jgi:hypothetical protein
MFADAWFAAISDSKFFGQGNNVYILSGLHAWVGSR